MMAEARRRLMQGVILGAFIGAGLMLVVFWRILAAAPNAGALVDGRFRPYRDDPTGTVIVVGGLILIAAAVAMLLVTMRGLRDASPTG